MIPEQITSLLNAYVNELGRIGFDLGNRYLPGGDETQVRRSLAEVGFEYPELVAFYVWRNGVNDSLKLPKGKICIFPGYYMLSLDEALNWYRKKHESGPFNSNYFLLFCADGYDFYHFSREEKSFEIIGMLEEIKGSRKFFIAPEFSSFEKMLRTFIDAVKEGGIVINRKGYLDYRDEEFSAVARRHNPNLAYYQDT